MEDFKVLIKIERVLYQQNCPIVLKKGICIKLLNSGRKALLLQFRNIYEKQIKSVTVAIDLYDKEGNCISQGAYRYQNLSVDPWTNFGGQQPIEIEQNNFKRIKFHVKEIEFATGEVWTGSGKMKVLPENVTLEEFAARNEVHLVAAAVPMAEQVVEAGKPQPEATTSGGEEQPEETVSSSEPQQEVAAPDSEEQPEANAPSVADETEIISHTKQKKAKEEQLDIKQLIRCIIIFVVVIAIIVFIVIFNKCYIQPEKQYKEAKELLDAGKYEEAYELLEDLDGYKDSKQILEESKEEQLRTQQVLSDYNEVSIVTNNSSTDHYTDMETLSVNDTWYFHVQLTKIKTTDPIHLKYKAYFPDNQVAFGGWDVEFSMQTGASCWLRYTEQDAAATGLLRFEVYDEDNQLVGYDDVMITE